MTSATFIFLITGVAVVFNDGLYAQSTDGYPRLLQGPMVGAVTHTSAYIWVRTSGPFPVAIEYGTHSDLRGFITTAAVATEKANDHVAVIELTNLRPATEYFYRVKVNSLDDEYLGSLPPFRLKTAPAPGERREARVAFGSCARFQEDRLQPIWAAVAAYEPDLFLWIGDNIYGDARDADILREEYRRQRDVATLQPVLRNIANLAIWDDHDYGLNDHDKTHPTKVEALKAFQQYWANPAYGLPDAPGVFFSYAYGAVDFFFLDVRYHRDPNAASETPQKTMLGPGQLTWLQAALKNSTAVFKVIISASGWSKAKGPGGDSWSAFLHERDALFNYIRDNRIAGVVLLSGDTHVGELNVIPWSEHGGYDFYDLVSSPLAQSASGGWMDRRPERRIRPVYFQTANFGFIDFAFDKIPRLAFNLIDVNGRQVWTPFELRADELANGVQSWPNKASDKEKRRQENYDAGKGYYEDVKKHP